jgi:biotin carboxyl carrier protein
MRVIHTVAAELVASIFKVVVAAGDSVSPGDTLFILESMKMEIPVICEVTGTVTEVVVVEGEVVTEGDSLAVITTD